MVQETEPLADNILIAFKGFTDAANAVLDFLNHRIGMGLWMVTRTRDDDWIILHARDHDYAIEPGRVLRWSDSFCSRMVKGLGPPSVSDVQEVPAYAEAPIGKQIAIGSYIDVPLTEIDGSLFGTICAVSPAPKPKQLEKEQPLVELMAQLLSTILSRELKADQVLRDAEMAQAQALRDELTGLLNRRGFDSLMAAEEERCARYGHAACVLAIDLDDLKEANDQRGHNAGDDLIRGAAKALIATGRKSDIIARVGGDEFVVLAVQCTEFNGHRLLNQLRKNFANAGVRASVGIAFRDPRRGLKQAYAEADEAMYRDKRAHRAVA